MTPDPIQLTEDVQIEDAFVDFNLNCSNKPELQIVCNELTFPTEVWEPVTGPKDEHWLSEHNGIIRGWQEGLPVSEETGRGWSPGTVEHEEYGDVERYEMLDHVVTRYQNDKRERSAFGAGVMASVTGTTKSYAITIELGQEIVDRYINGPLGSETVPYWLEYSNQRGSGWGSRRSDREKFEGYETCDVVLLYDRIYTWYPERIGDVEADDVVYDSR